MPTVQIKIMFTDVSIHQVRNCGEQLFRTFRHDRKADITLDQADAAIDELVIEIFDSKRYRQHIMKLVAEVLEKARLADRAKVEF